MAGPAKQKVVWPWTESPSLSAVKGKEVNNINSDGRRKEINWFAKDYTAPIEVK